CRSRSRRTPPFEASPLRKQLGVERARFVTTFGLVLRTQRNKLSGICSAQKDFARWISNDAGDLRRTGLGQLSENSAALDGQQRTGIAETGQQTSVVSEPERVNDLITRSPEFLGRAIGSNLIDAAGNRGRKRDVGSLRLAWGSSLDRSDHGNVSS